jgi:periplasmic copper chaperone A
MRLPLATLLCFALLAPAASAHVTVIPAAARPGQTETLSFRVLNERANARTVRVMILVPGGLNAAASDRPGWTRVDRPGIFDWRAKDAGAAISGAGAKDFEIRVGPLPHRERVVFKALQYYSDGEIVRWIRAPEANAERPAPVLQLTATGAPAGGGGGSSGAGFAVLGGLLVAAAGVAAFRRRRAR